MSVRARLRLRFAGSNKDAPVGAVPGGDLMSPPQLTRDAPWLDIFHPIEIRGLPLLGNERGAAVTHRADCLLRQGFGVHVPLVREKRFGHGGRAVAVRHRMHVRFDFLDEPCGFHARDDALARPEPI